MKPYTVQNTLVKGNGWSYNLTSKVDAIKLCETLNQLDTAVTLHQNLDQQFDNIQRQIIQLKLSVNTLRDEINTLGEVIDDINNNTH